MVKNLIFDLGGVILDLSVDHTFDAFARLAGVDQHRVKEVFSSERGFEVYEKGMMDDAAFRDLVRQACKVQITDHDIDVAWNAMLRSIPMAKLDLLTRLKERYNVYLLSNTNNIHLSYINEVMMPALTGEKSLDGYFHRAYYSHLMRKRKPDAEIFEQVLAENRLIAEHTLFLDDNAMNIEGARSLGIGTVHVTTGDLILEYFHD